MKDMMLVVDDDYMNRQILRVIFERQYELLEAENGQEALEILEGCQGSIDIVLLDLVMPNFTGFEVLEKRQQIDYFRKIPVVVITSSETMEDQVKAFNLGANEYILKPFVPEIVSSRVNNVMASNRRMLSIELEAEKMKIKSELDEMTGLCNKSTTEYSMDKILKMSEGCLEVMVVIDIDSFKAVNDSSGHQAGDHVIKIVANLISGLFRKTDVTGRIGGDEFCAMMVDVPNMEIVYQKVNELIQIMRYKPNLTIPEYVTLSIGIASNEKKATSYAELFQKADAALYESKRAGKAQYREYGVEPIKAEEDERSVVVLLSDNRNVCSAVHAMIPAYLRVVEALTVEELDNVSKLEREKMILLYADVSDLKDDTNAFWDTLKDTDWISMDHVLAVCEEGNVPQYMQALQSGVADMITMPIDQESFKRKSERQLEKLGYKEITPTAM